MEFSLSEEQRAVTESAAAVFGGMALSERVADVERTADRFDERLWEALARANLLGLAVPAELGGSGLGLLELCVVLEAQGRAVAPVPLWSTTVLGAMPIARLGTDEQRERWLPGVVSGAVKLSAALTEVATDVDVARPSVTASRAEGGWRLDGTARAVPQAHLADRVLVPVAVDGGMSVLLVDPRGDGARLERAVTTDRQVHPHLHLEGLRVGDAEVLAGPAEGAGAVGSMLEWARTGLCAVAVGVCEEAVRRTAAFLNERHQFGRALSSFQATQMRTADAHIDTEAIRVMLWEAAWRLDTGRPAAEAVAAAKWWAAEAGQRVVHATQHLHGGVGADVEYPIHRYFLWGKQIELMLGGPSSELARLGSLLAQRLRRSPLREPNAAADTAGPAHASARTREARAPGPGPADEDGAGCTRGEQVRPGTGSSR